MALRSTKNLSAIQPGQKVDPVSVDLSTQHAMMQNVRSAIQNIAANIEAIETTKQVLRDLFTDLGIVDENLLQVSQSVGELDPGGGLAAFEGRTVQGLLRPQWTMTVGGSNLAAGITAINLLTAGNQYFVHGGGSVGTWYRSTDLIGLSIDATTNGNGGLDPGDWTLTFNVYDDLGVVLRSRTFAVALDHVGLVAKHNCSVFDLDNSIEGPLVVNVGEYFGGTLAGPATDALIVTINLVFREQAQEPTRLVEKTVTRTLTGG